MNRTTKLNQAIAFFFCAWAAISLSLRHLDRTFRDLSTNDGVTRRTRSNCRQYSTIAANAVSEGQKPDSVVGGFAFDYGCVQGAFVNSQYLTVDDKAFPGLRSTRWGGKPIDLCLRKTAQAWVANGLLAFLTVISVGVFRFCDHFKHHQALPRGWHRCDYPRLECRQGRVRGTGGNFANTILDRRKFGGVTTLESFRSRN
jgi:hypothetical protein